MHDIQRYCHLEWLQRHHCNLQMDLLFPVDLLEHGEQRTCVVMFVLTLGSGARCGSGAWEGEVGGWP